MKNALPEKLSSAGNIIYENSVREINPTLTVFVAKKDDEKYVGIAQNGDCVSLPVIAGSLRLDSGERVTLHPLDWANYLELRKAIPLTPVTCDKSASFGTGDRMGMVTAAHLAAHSKYPVFPIIAQQSPRELERTNRDFKDVLLKAVMGVLESGYTGTFGADADHIKDEKRFMEGVEAGFSMYTLDVSDDLRDINGFDPEEISDNVMMSDSVSKQIIVDYAGKRIDIPGGSYTFSADELSKSVLIYEKSMQQAVRFYNMAKTRISALDLEVSIDEGSRDTTPEDHLFVAEFLHRGGVDFRSLAPKFPGEFQKAVDYRGDYDKLYASFNIHAKIARMMGGYRLSMHSGSDKFSVYKAFGEATQGNFHIKTSGTSWLQAVRLIANADMPLFNDLYAICLDTLPESKKAYHVDITPAHFPAEVPKDHLAFFDNPDVQQLFHISYGALLDRKRDVITAALKANESDHYGFVTGHIDRHLKLAFGEI